MLIPSSNVLRVKTFFRLTFFIGGIKGFEVGYLSGFDIKATDNTLFADIKNKHNTMNKQ